MCGRRADDVRTTYVIRHLKSPTKSHSRVVRTSSARRPHVVCMSYASCTHETSVPRLFQVKQQRTALLKTRKPWTVLSHNYFMSNDDATTTEASNWNVMRLFDLGFVYNCIKGKKSRHFHRESNLMFTLSSDKDQRKNNRVLVRFLSL